MEFRTDALEKFKRRRGIEMTAIIMASKDDYGNFYNSP